MTLAEPNLLKLPPLKVGLTPLKSLQKAIGEGEKEILEKDEDSGEGTLADKFAALSTLLATVSVAVISGYTVHPSFRGAPSCRAEKNTGDTSGCSIDVLLTSDNKNTKRSAFIAVKVLGNASLMVDLAKSDLESEGAREALRDLKAHGALKEDRDLAIAALAPYEFAPYCELPFREVAVSHDDIDMTCGMWGKLTSPDATRTQI